MGRRRRAALLICAILGGVVALPSPAFATPTVREFSAGLSAASGPNAIARGPDGAMWFTERDGGRIGRVTVDGHITEYPTSGPGLTPGALPAGIVTGPDGNVWFAEFGAGQIGELDPATGRLIGEYPVPTAGSAPDGIAVGPDGALWFAENGSGKLGRIDPSAVTPGTSDGITEYLTKDTDAFHSDNAPIGLVTGPDGALWVTVRDGIDRIVPASVAPGTTDGVSYFTHPGGTMAPQGIASGPDGYLWVADYGEQKVVQVDPVLTLTDETDGIIEFPTAGGSPLLVAAAGDGGLWFSEQSTGLLRVDPANANAPTVLGGPQGVTGDATGVASDAAGNLWYTEFASDRIGVVVLAGAPTPGAPTIAALPPRAGQPETCDPDAAHWGGSPVFTRQWLLNGAPIPAATGAAYTPSDADVLGQLSCRVTGTNAAGSAVATSATATVAPATAGGGPGGTATPPPGTPAPTASIVDTTPSVRAGQKLTLTAAGSSIPAGQRASSYTFSLGTTNPTVATCPGSDPRLLVATAQAVSTTATVTVKTNLHTTASATTPIVITLPKSLPVASTHSTPARSAAGATSLGAVGAISLECTPAAGPRGTTGGRRSISSYTTKPQAPISNKDANAQPASCSGAAPDDIQLGIIDGLGCWQEVDATHPLGAAEAKLLCGHKKQADICHYVHSSLSSVLQIPAPAGARATARIGAGAVIDNASRLTYDEVWYSKQPVGIDGLEIDPVGDGEIVLARAGTESSGFTSGDTAVLLSSDAMVRVGGLPITLQVPDYSKLYAQGKSVANCAQTAAQGLADNNLSSADCLGSLSIPSITDVANALKLPNIHGPIDLSVGPKSLGIELGSFEIPKDVLPLPVLPQLPLSGRIQVNLTGIGAATVGIHVELPILSDGMGHGLTGDTKLSIDNVNGLELDNLDIRIPSLAQLGLARLRNLEFIYAKPSHYEGMGTIDLSDIIHGMVRLHVLFDKGRFQQGDAHYFSSAGDGLPLFGPLFLTQADLALTASPSVDVKGHALLSVGPAVTNNGCGALGIDGTIDLNFGNPWSLDATGQASILCATLGPSKIFHADSDGNFSYDEHFDFSLPGDLNVGVSGDLGGSAYLNTNTGELDFQIDGKYAAHGGYHKCVTFIATECVDVGFSAQADATLALGLQHGRPVGGTGLCLHLDTPIGGFDVGAGVDDLPNAILAAGTDNFPGLVSRLQILLSNCDVSRWRLIKPAAGFSREAHGAQAAAPFSVSVPSGQKMTIIGIQGTGDAPRVAIKTPAGQTIDTTQPGISLQGDALVIRQSSSAQTEIEIPNAKAGAYTVTPMPGSAPIAMVETAKSVPPPVITATVSGTGLKRVLHYTVTSAQPGLAVSFAEGAAKGARTIGTAHGARGTIAFAPALGRAGSRSIVAHVTRNGLAQPGVVVGHYMPGTVRPGRASHIGIRRLGGRWRIAWRPGSGATRQLLTVRFIDGQQVLLEATGAQRLLRIPRAVDAGAQPTAVEIDGLRGTVRGPVAGTAIRLAKR